MSRRRRRPPEARRLSYAEATLWELCAALDILPYRQRSVWAGLDSPRERRAIRRERELMDATRLQYAPPRPARGGRPARPHLYILTGRGAYIRIHEGDAQIAHWRHVRAAPGRPGGWRWEHGPPRGARWAEIVADGLRARSARRALDAAPEVPPIPGDAPAAAPPDAAQLTLWP